MTERSITSLTSQDGRITGLDGLRSLAIMGVTFFHLFPQQLRGGYLGVSLFFVLTGFLLAYTSEKSARLRDFSLKEYVIKRLKRIYPSLILMLLTTLGVFYMLAPTVLAGMQTELLSVVLGYNNWWQIAQNADYFTRMLNQSPYTHLWFLGIELQYYALWPILFILYRLGIRRFGFRPALLAILFLALVSSLWMPFSYEPGVDVTRLYYGTDMRIYALLFGAALGLYQSHYTYEEPTYRKCWYSLFILGLGCTCAAYGILDGSYAITYQGAMWAMTVIFCILIFIAANPYLSVGRYLDSSLFRWIGKKSYALFLWQYPVIFLFQYMHWTDGTYLNGVHTVSLLSGLSLTIDVSAAAVWIAPLAELSLIILLSIWSDCITSSLTTFHLPRANQSFVTLQLVLFLLIALPPFVMAGYGCKGIFYATSHATTRTNHVQKLQEQMKDNEQFLQSQQTESVKQEEPSYHVEQTSSIACIGDSVMLGSAKALKEAFPNCYIDAKVSRYVGAGTDVARSMNDNGHLGDTVLIALGTNGPLDGQYEGDTERLLSYLGKDRHIYWVNVYCPNTSWQESNNTYLEKLSDAHSNVTIIDWKGPVSKHPEWLAEDGIHPNPTGAKEYAHIIKSVMTGKEEPQKGA